MTPSASILPTASNTTATKDKSVATTATPAPVVTPAATVTPIVSPTTTPNTPVATSPAETTPPAVTPVAAPTPIDTPATTVATSAVPITTPTTETTTSADAPTTPITPVVNDETPAAATPEATPAAVSPDPKPEVASSDPKPPPKKEVIPDEVIPLEKKNDRLYKIGIALFVIIIISTASIFYMRTKTSIKTADTGTTPVPSIEAIPSSEPSPSPTPEVIALERDEITLEILNGTSVSGLAGKTAKEFEELGYEIGNLGNADNAKNNQLYVKTEFVDQLENLLEDVEEKLDITEIEGEVDDLDTTVRIILGTE